MTISIKPTASGSTIEQDGSTILTVDGSGNIAIANDLSVTGNVPANTGPAFSAYQSSGQSISNATATKINFSTEEFDTDNCYNTATYRFTPTTAGKYFIYTSLEFDAQAVDVFHRCYLMIYKNGSLYRQAWFDGYLIQQA